MSSFCKPSNYSLMKSPITPITFFPFRLSRLFKNNESSGKPLIKSTRCSSTFFFIFTELETSSRCLAGKLNQEIPFAFLPRHAEDYIFSPRAAALFLVWHDTFAIQLSFCPFFILLVVKFLRKQRSNRRNEQPLWM